MRHFACRTGASSSGRPCISKDHARTIYTRFQRQRIDGSQRHQRGHDRRGPPYAAGTRRQGGHLAGYGQYAPPAPRGARLGKAHQALLQERPIWPDALGLGGARAAYGRLLQSGLPKRRALPRSARGPGPERQAGRGRDDSPLRLQRGRVPPRLRLRAPRSYLRQERGHREGQAIGAPKRRHYPHPRKRKRSRATETRSRRKGLRPRRAWPSSCPESSRLGLRARPIREAILFIWSVL